MDIETVVSASITSSTTNTTATSTSPQPDTSLHCQTTDTGVVHSAVCRFTSQLSLVLVAPTHGDGRRTGHAIVTPAGITNDFTITITSLPLHEQYQPDSSY